MEQEHPRRRTVPEDIVFARISVPARALINDVGHVDEETVVGVFPGCFEQFGDHEAPNDALEIGFRCVVGLRDGCAGEGAAEEDIFHLEIT